MPPSKDQYDCIIVGAGMSGLCCASKLAKRGHRVLVLEARDRIGGRVCTAFGPNDEPVDLGASFVHGVDGNPLAKMAKEHGIKLYPGNMQIIAFKPDGSLLGENTTYTLEGNLYSALFGRSREHSRQNILPPTQSLDSFLQAPDSALFDGLNDEEKDYAQRVSQSMDKWTGASLDEVSLKYWGFEREFEGSDKVVADGYIHLLEPLRKTILDYGGQIQLSTTITSFTHDSDVGIVELKTSKGTAFTAKSAICTLPLGVLKHSPEIFNPPLPPRRLDAINKVGFGLLNKVVLIYPEVWWPEDVYIMRIFLPPPSAADEPVRGGATISDTGADRDLPPGLATKGLFVQSYYPLTKRPMLAFFFGGHSGDALERISDERAVTWLHAVLKRCLTKLPGAPKEGDVPLPSSSFVSHWRADPLSRGTYSYLPVAEEGKNGDEHASPVHLLELSRALWDGRLGFAGEHTEVDHYATVHGPAISGWREADRVHALLKSAWTNN